VSHSETRDSSIEIARRKSNIHKREGIYIALTAVTWRQRHAAVRNQENRLQEKILLYSVGLFHEWA